MTDVAIVERSGVEVTPIGWRPKRELSFEEWKRELTGLLHVHRASQWCIGDCINAGEDAEYGAKYREALEATGYQIQTLTDFAWVARKVEISRRREILSWAHHREVAPLDPGQQDSVLSTAAEKGWSREQLRKSLGGGSGGNGNGRQPDTDLTSHIVIGDRKLKLTFTNKNLKRRTEEALRAHAEDVGYS